MKTNQFDGHTPGPWIRDGNYILTKLVQNSTGIGDLIAKLPPFDARKYVGENEGDYMKRRKEGLATGDLIAAAPELLRVARLAKDAVEAGAVDKCYLSLIRDALSLLPNIKAEPRPMP